MVCMLGWPTSVLLRAVVRTPFRVHSTVVVVVVAVTVFKCGVMGPDCSTCQSIQAAPRTSKFGCQWCGDRCQHNSTCDRARLQTTSKCPLPVIESVPSNSSSGGITKKASYRQACRGYEISHSYPYPYPQIFTWISMDISISIDA